MANVVVKLAETPIEPLTTTVNSARSEQEQNGFLTLGVRAPQGETVQT
jgi:hypothetical protein